MALQRLSPSSTKIPRKDMSSPYTSRNLKASEVQKFLDHLASVFGLRAGGGTPRALFEDHWFNDPHRDLQGVWVAVVKNADGEEEIVSSVRVYLRKLNLGAYGHVECGAIGDVATSPAHTGCGLASQLMQKAIGFMEERHLNVGMLHTSSAAKLYSKLGWKTFPMRTIILRCNHGDLSSHATQSLIGRVQPIDFELNSHFDTVRRLHAKFAPPGSFVRSEAFWREWVAPTPRDPRRIVRKLILDAEPGHAQAYMIADMRAGNIEQGSPIDISIREFFAENVTPDDASPRALSEVLEVFTAMVFRAISHLVHTSLVKESKIQIHLPSALLPPVVLLDAAKSLSWLSPNGLTIAEDNGGMFRVVQGFTPEAISSQDGHPAAFIAKEEDLFELFKDSFGFLKTDNF